MNAADGQRLVQHIHRLAGANSAARSDGELLRRYLDAGDQAAFAALMRRHATMVFSVCHSVLRQRDDAEDALQAAFLILAQKAASIRRQEALGGWLQRVAYHVALRSRARRTRRQTQEARAISPAASSPCDDLTWGEVRSILHAELAALPEQFRTPLVLCYLEGLTQEEAARQLGWTAATVKGRLQRGREKLRRRLERRGIGLTAALAAALTGQAMAETTVASWGLPAMTTATTAATILAREFLRPWLPIRLMILSALLLSMGAGLGGMVLRSPPSEPRPAGSGPSSVKANEKQAETRAAVDRFGDPLPEGAVARLGTVRFNHGEGLHGLFFSADGKTIFSQGNGSVCSWDASNGKKLDRVLTNKPYFEFPTILRADGKTLVSLSEGIDNRDVATFVDLGRKKRIRTKEMTVRRQVLSTDHQDSLSPDGALCVLHVHTPPSVQVSSVEDGKVLFKLGDGSRTFRAVTFAGNERIVSADDHNRIDVWAARSGKILRHFDHDAPIRYLLTSPDGRCMASLEQRPSPFGRPVERQEVVNLWDMNSGKVTQTLRAKARHGFTNVCFSPDGKVLLTSSRSPGDADEVILWDRETGRRLLHFDAASGINADIAAISPDGNRLAAGDRSGKFELWELKKGQRLSANESRSMSSYSTVFLTPDGERATVISRASISFWDVTNGRRLHTFGLPRGTLDPRGPSCDDRHAVTCRVEGQEFHVLIWDTVARRCLHTLRFPGGYQQITSALSPNSSLLAIRHPDKQTVVRLWDVRSGKLLRSFEENKAGWPGKMTFTADGKTLFVAGKHIVGYQTSTGKELFSWRLKPSAPLSGVRTTDGGAPATEDNRPGWATLVISPEGEWIAATPWPGSVGHGSKEDALTLYDARTGKLVRQWQDSRTSPHSFKQLTFSADGQILASSNGEAIQLWEVAPSKLIRVFKGHKGQINSLMFSRDGRRLASASSDSTVLIWDVTGVPAKAAALTETIWNDLAGEDAGRANRAVWTLIQAPRESTAFLRGRLHPVKPVRRDQMDRWVRELDADALAVRQKAVVELEKLSELAEPSLRRALENRPSLELRRRIEPMLAKLETAIPSGDALRSLRTVRVLEHIGTTDACALLRELARGAEGATLTHAAQAALTRRARSLTKATP